MKNYRSIYEEIEANKEAIAAAAATIDKLSYKEERAELVKKDGRMGDYKALKAKADQNAGKIAELSESIYLLKVENLILSDNMKAAITAEALPAILAAGKKYEGKKHGPKTADAIREEVKKAGFFVYISSDGMTAHVSVVNPENMCSDYRFPDIKIHTRYNAPFVTKENKINFTAAETETPAYIEDTKSRAAAVIAAYNKYYAAREAADKARDELNSIMPDGRYYTETATVYKTIF